jgi:hypothetical protein
MVTACSVLALLGVPPGPSLAQTGATATPAAGPAMIRIGQTLSGALQPDDPSFTSGERHDTWTFDARAGELVTVSMQSRQFDTYLIVNGPMGVAYSNDDAAPGGGNTDAAVTFQTPVAGRYTILASAFESGATGAYTLRVSSRGVVSANAADPVARTPATPLQPGVAQTGSLANSDVARANGHYVDVYSFQATAGERVGVTLGGGFDTLVTLVGPDGTRQSNDDARAGTTDSYLEARIPQTGTWRVEVSSYERGVTGDYTVSVGAPAQASPAGNGGDDTARAGALAAATPVTVGTPVTGALAAGDRTRATGELVDSFRFDGRRGETVRIEATSSQIDTWLTVRPPPGGRVAENDDGPEGTNARIDMTLPVTGSYLVDVSSYAIDETGDYQLSLQPVTPTGRTAGGGDAVRGRVYGVFVGVSDYPGMGNDLPNTDKDARDLAATLRENNLLAPESVVLIDRQATVEAVSAAISRVSALAGPDDTFVLFFSGHGVQNPVAEANAASSSELDGRDEALVLYDGEVLDDQLAGLVRSQRAGLTLIVLDACFSGGFARDMVNRPGVMGLFSSEEDLTSQVAGKFEAGGYLSHFVRQALSGAADRDGNLMVTAGELSAFVRTSFAAEGDIEATTGDDARDYQVLVVERGAVKVDDVVVALRE